MEYTELILELVSAFSIVYIISFVAGMIFKLGFNLVDNKTKKVCDLCFRDIKKWNEVVKNEVLVRSSMQEMVEEQKLTKK